MTLAPAERGCMLSHVKMWEDFVASDAEWALIAEDDVLISLDAEAVVNAIITKYPQVQLVNLCDAYSFKAGTMNPRLGYIVCLCCLLLCTVSTVWVSCTVRPAWVVPVCT